MLRNIGYWTGVEGKWWTLMYIIVFAMLRAWWGDQHGHLGLHTSGLASVVRFLGVHYVRPCAL